MNQKYLYEIEKLKSEQKINDDEYYLLRTHRMAINLLEEKTLGDPENFTDRTPEEILSVIKRSIQKEGEKKFLDEREKHKETYKELYNLKKKNEKTEENINNLSTKISNVIGWAVVILICLLFLLGTCVQFIPDLLKNKTLLRTILIIFTILLGTLAVYVGFNIKGFGSKLREKLKKVIIKLLKGIIKLISG